jgi:MFS family permease
MNAERGIGWYHGWNIVGVCVLSCIALNALPVNAFSLFLKDWSADLHTPVSTFQLGIAGLGIGSALLSPFAGALADKMPARTMFAIGLAVMALVCLGISFMTAPWQFIVLYAVPLPIAIALATLIPANAVVSRWFVRRLGLALATVGVGLGMGGVIMPIVVAHVMPDIGWRGIWRIAGIVVAVVVLPLAIAVMRDRPTEREGLHYLTGDGAAGLHHGHGGPAGASGVRWRDIWASRNFWLLVITYLPMLAVYGGVGQNLGPIAESHGMSQQTAGILVSIFGASQVVATLLAGILSDRFGNRLPLAGYAIATALGGVIAAYADGVATLGLGAILAALGSSFWPLLAAAIAVEFGAGGVGRGFGMVTFFLPFAVMAPFAAAKTQEVTGSYTPALLVMAALSLIAGLICALFMRERRSGSGQNEAPAEDAPVPAA